MLYFATYLHTKLAASELKNIKLFKAGIEHEANNIKAKHQEEKVIEL